METNSFAEQKALEAIKLPAFKEINLSLIKDKLEVILGKIGANGIFDSYTKHDISHVDGILKSLDKIIPEQTKNVMTGADWLLTTLSVYFHDMGMFVRKEEFEQRDSNREFQNFSLNMQKNPSLMVKLAKLPNDEKERFLYQEYVRHNHGKRVEKWINYAGDEICNGFEAELNSIFSGFSDDLKESLASICASHQEDDLNLDMLDVDKAFGASDAETSNLLYVALLLRTADLLHVTSERTPSTEFNIIDIKDPISQLEWAKQRAVTKVDVYDEKNAEGDIDHSRTPCRFQIHATFKDPEAYFAFDSYLNYVEKELKKNHQLFEKNKGRIKGNYEYPWIGINRDKIVGKGFETKKLFFEIDKEKILKLLMGHTLYNDTTVVLRELVQNAIDACRLYESTLKSTTSYVPLVKVILDKDNHEIIVKDNGTGMSRDVVFNHLLKVGSSRYQDQTFIDEHPKFHSISHFGIGLLTCFMVCDDIEIYTKEYGAQTRLLQIRDLHGNFIMRDLKDNQQILEESHGSTFVLKLRPEIETDNFEEIIHQWILLPSVSVSFIYGEKEEKVGFDTAKEAIESFLKSQGTQADNISYKIESYEEDGFEVTSLLKKDIYSNVWKLCETQGLDLSGLNPLGICIEGIRVTFKTPGFTSNNYVALVNCKGEEAPYTNVARTSIERGERYDKLLKVIYTAYLKIVEHQIDDFKSRYSMSWATSEICYAIEKMVDFGYSNNISSIVSPKIFEECVQSLPFLTIEQNSCRQLVSLVQFPNEIWTIENEAYKAATDIMKEVKDEKFTSIGIVENCVDSFEKGEFSCSFPKQYTTNYLNEIFYAEFHISKLKGDKEKRKLCICWKRNDKEEAKRWIVVNVSVSRRYNSFSSVRKLFVPLDDNFDFSSNESDFAVFSSQACILLPNNQFYSILRKMYSEISNLKGRAADVLTSFVMHFILVLSKKTRGEIKQYIDTHGIGSNDFWKDFSVSRQDFIDAIPENGISIFSNVLYYTHDDDDDLPF